MSEQGSHEWLMERLGHVSCSRFCDVMTQARNKGDRERGVLSQTAESYMLELIAEHLTKKPTEEIKAKALEWGERWEPVARETYRQSMNHEVQQVGFVKHPSERFIGGSPDSLVGADGLMEIKCPLTGREHARVLVTDQVPAEHAEQIQGNLWVSGRYCCHFISYHDDFPHELRLAVIRVERDEQYIEKLAERVIAFRDEMLRRLETILELWKAKAA